MKIPADEFIRMPLSELTTPHEGRIVYLNRWWCVTDKEEALFFRTYSSPQCNDSKRMCEHLCAIKSDILVEPVFVPVAYVPIVWSDYT